MELFISELVEEKIIIFITHTVQMERIGYFPTCTIPMQLYNPHGSDGTLTEVACCIYLSFFITHTVQMEQLAFQVF